MRGFLGSVMDTEDSRKTLSLVQELTDVYTKEAYPHLNSDKRKQKELERFQKTSAEAQTIKYADILDNGREIVGHDSSFAPKYLKECIAILKTATKGNQDLHQLALETLLDEQKKLGKTHHK